MYICIEGCAHGDLDKIYSQIAAHEREFNKKVDLLICCGDFQATRNLSDLACMAVPQKYLEMGTFYKYYDGSEQAPVLTIFIGGNHEASNHLQELSYGGWVAPNIYYLGYAGVITVNGVRIAGISGIYRNYNYHKGHYECPPYDNNTVRTVYSMRNLEVFRMLQLTPSKIDIMLSHDWPQGIWNYGDSTKRFGRIEGLLRLKPDFKADMDSGKLGNPPCTDLLMTLKPRHWYAAHMHCRFDAKVDHGNDEFTQFVALDKCLPARSYFDFISLGDEVQRDEEGNAILDLQYDPEWLAILVLTNKFLNCSQSNTNLPSQGDKSRWNFTPTPEEIELVRKRLNNDFEIKHNFKQTVNSFNPDWEHNMVKKPLPMPVAEVNIQTTEFCQKLNIDDPLLVTAELNKVQVKIPKYDISDQEAFKDCNIVSEEATPSRKTVLSLPKPKNMNSDEIDLDDLEDDEDEGVKVSEKVELQTKDEKLETKCEEPEKVIEPDVEQPAAKKFKRRNQDIYTATDE